jgi:integrase
MFHLVVTVARLVRPGGLRSVVAESVLVRHQRLIAKLAALLAGMRQGEIFALTWGRMAATHADIRQRVYRRKLDTPKTDNSYREAALSEGLLRDLRDIEAWRPSAATTADEAWVFPSERMTLLSKDNCWRGRCCRSWRRSVWNGEFSCHASHALDPDEMAWA